MPSDRKSPAAVEVALTPNALAVLENRYLIRDENGGLVETPAGLFRRVAGAVAGTEAAFGVPPDEIRRTAEESFEMMAAGRFLPNSPTLMNAGRPLGLLSACFVLPLEDSISDIMETARQIALVQRAGGGTGIDFSALRPKGSVVRSSGGTTDGPLSFLKMLSGVTDAIQQGAFRRGANMGVLRIDHPDILAFIDLKSDLSVITNYNLSVAVTDDFMEALRSTPNSLHRVVNPHTGLTGVLSRNDGVAHYGPATQNAVSDDYYTVGEVWERIVDRAWKTGDPGLLFLDEMNRHNPTPHLGPIRATNPCGEQPLLPYEACNLGSINLAVFHRVASSDSCIDPIDWNLLEETVERAVRFLDDVVEANRYPTEEIRDATLKTRKVGLGVMGFADLLFKLGIPYDSDDGVGLADRIGAFIRETAWNVSTRLAEARGSFPAWSGSIWDTQRGSRPMRNAQFTAIAPTGTISIIAGCSSGIEPVFSLAFDRRVLGGQRLVEVNPVFRRALAECFHDQDMIGAVVAHAAEHGSIQDRADVPDQLKKVFRTARDISPEWHVRMQAAWQRHTDAAVSKTVNLWAGASRDDVANAFLLAHEMKCKGITVYRDGARPLQPMALSGGEPAIDDTAAPPATRHPVRLPEIMPSIRLRQKTPFGNMHLHVSVDSSSGLEREVFAQLGKGGDLANSDLEGICRLISLLLRTGSDLRTVIDQLDAIGSSLSIPSADGRIKSLPDAIARALQKYMAAKERDGLDALLQGSVHTLQGAEQPPAMDQQSRQEMQFALKCPECDSAGTLAFEEGCLKCHACGYALC